MSPGARKLAVWVGAALVGASAAWYFAAARPARGTDGSGFADGFRTVDTRYKPRVRWWWPGASVAHDELIREVNEIADAGFGGVEIADVYDSISAFMDPSLYGWGTILLFTSDNIDQFDF